MTATQLSPADLAPTTSGVEHRSAFSWAVRDSRTITMRNLISITRQPQLIVFSTIQPIIFVLMFTYVFGGAIHINEPYSYVDYLMPGIFCQTVVFGAINTGIGLSDDLQKGLIERFRSLPMARSAVLAGRTVADLVRNVFVVLLMLIVGYMVGFRVQTNVFGLLAGIAVLLFFAFSMTWIFAIVGLSAPSPETAQAMSFPILAPLVFASSAFVSTSTMPGWLQVFANHQPVTAAVNATRALMLGGPTATYVWESLAWSIGIVVVFAPFAIRRYRRVA
jgi:ABC transporter DrrB family efflux protein